MYNNVRIYHNPKIKYNKDDMIRFLARNVKRKHNCLRAKKFSQQNPHNALKQFNICNYHLSQFSALNNINQPVRECEWEEKSASE